MISIERLRYVRLGTPDLATSVNFAQQVLGLELASHTDSIAYFRSDFRDPSLTFTTDVQGHAVALELRDIESLDTAAKVLVEAGYVVERGTADQCAESKVKARSSPSTTRAVHKSSLSFGRSRRAGGTFHRATLE